MARPLSSPDHLFDRTWRPGHPFRPRLSRLRRVGMIILLVLLCLIIAGYWWITDSTRVKRIAQNYLSELTGGQVEIGGATLSVFQGLKLREIRIYTDATRDDDSLIFRAQSVLLRVNDTALFHGRFEASQIVAIDPFVRLVENVTTGRWNHQTLRRPTSMPSSKPGARPPLLPEVILRNAIVEYAQIDHGERKKRGTIAIEAQLLPSQLSDEYLFKMQSRGAREGIGPSVEGRFEMSSGAVTASMMNFHFGADLETMLPQQVRQWWKDHDLAGRVDVPQITYQPASADGSIPRSFRAEIDVRGVTLVVHPYEWLSPDEMSRDAALPVALSTVPSAGLDALSFVSAVQRLTQPTNIGLDQVSGRFVFAEKSIDIDGVSGFVAGNGLQISGRVENYSTPSTATASIRVASLESHDIVVPESPRYINSMPLPVREIYSHLRPQGHCKFWVQLTRNAAPQRPQVAGEIDLLDGRFLFDNFPYPVVGATGKLLISMNPTSGEEQLEIQDIVGHGPAGGANEKANVRVNGLVSPFGAETGVHVRVESDDVQSEPLLFAAFPRETREALKMFDAPGKGEYPKFRGGFMCDVTRPRGLKQHWKVFTQIRLADAAGQLVAFPYPMSGVSGLLTVTEDHVQLEHVSMKRGDASMQIDGDVSWGNQNSPATNTSEFARAVHATTQPDEPPNLRPKLHIVANAVPIDGDLLHALPADQRAWMQRLQMAGTFDLVGDVDSAKNPKLPIDFNFGIHLHNGSAFTQSSGTAITAIDGAMNLTPGEIAFESLKAKRGAADLSMHGTIDWNGSTPTAVFAANATNLQLDQSLHDILPATAKGAWDQVQPSGTIDAALNYNGAFADTSGSTTAPSTAPSNMPSTAAPPPADFALVLSPRELSIMPAAAPYRLDHVGGTVNVSPQKITLDKITGRHGTATINLSGSGAPDASSAALNWKFQLSGDNVPMDDDFNRATPAVLGALMKSLALHGTIGFDFDKLDIGQSPGDSTSAHIATPTATDAPANVDFAVRFHGNDLAMDAGVPITNADGVSAQFAGTTRDGALSQLQGAVVMPTLTLAGRPATNLEATFLKTPDSPVLHLSRLQTRVADGDLAGQFDCTVGDANTSRYAAAVVLRNADVKQLTGDTAAGVRARLSASLALEGSFTDPTSRRGRGDVTVSGEQLYRIPLFLGLLQVINLSMPITSPFNEGMARYSIEGNRLAFETIELRAKDMMMQGSGVLDFGTKQVRLTFVTDSTTWPKLPIIGDLIAGARHELLQIHVKGTIQEPQVSAGTFGTVSTTVDEVLRGGPEGAAYVRVPKH